MALFMPTSSVMQEISLYCLIPNARHAQVLRILSAICNMNPEPQLVHHLLYKPKRPKPLMMIGAGQQEMYYLQLIAKVDEAEFEEKKREIEGERRGVQEKGKGREEDVVMIDFDGDEVDKNRGNQLEEKLYDIKKQRWTIQFSDFPDASPKPAETRRVIFLAEVGDGDALAFMEDFGYMYISEYVTSGYNLYHGNLVISLTQTFVPTIQHQPLPRELLRNIDPAQAWVCKVSVKVAQVQVGPNTVTGVRNEQHSLMEMGSKELHEFQQLVRGVGVELEMGERLALDTRVK
ncbi:mediator complex, subunit Med18 [Tirmania nivea]|nr:mediator complex, subunit Med18 [Tirmania nivea]